MDRTIITISLATAGLMGGCVSPQARRGRVVEAQVGERAPSFTFQDERGKTHELAGDLGDFTVLIFSECGTDMHREVSNELLDLVRANQEPGYVETVGFDIHWSRDGCPQHSDCHLLEGGPRVYSICDARAQARDLFGAHLPQEIVIIGPDRRIVLRAPASDIDSVAASLDSMFQERRERVLQERSPDE